VIRIRTTGGGGWGDPLDRPYDEVLRDIAWGKVSVAGAWADYGVRVVDGILDEAVSDGERAQRRADRSGEEPFFDRGPGYVQLSGGRQYADVDFVSATSSDFA
jgi:N-methylhydantoinase B